MNGIPALADATARRAIGATPMSVARMNAHVATSREASSFTAHATAREETGAITSLPFAV